MSRRGFAALLLGATLMGAFLALNTLVLRSITFDESVSIAVARLDWAGFWSAISRREANMVLYYLLLRPWLLLGEGEAAVRSLSVVFAVAAIPFVYLTGRQLVSRRVGLGAAALLASNAFFVHTAQVARGYALLLLLVSVASYLLVRCMEKPSRGNAALYSLAIILAVHAHLLAVLVAVAHACSIPLFRPRGLRGRTLALWALLTGAGILPLLVLVIARETNQLSWVPPLGAHSLPMLFFTLSSDRTVVGALVYAVFVPLALVPTLRARAYGENAGQPAALGVLLVWLLVPIALATLISLVKPILVARYFSLSLPPLVLLAAVGLTGWGSFTLSEKTTRLWRRDVGAFLVAPAQRMYGAWLALAVALSVFGVFRSHQLYGVDDWRAATEDVLWSAHAEDAVVVFSPMRKLTFDYYRRRLGHPGGTPAYAYPRSDDVVELQSPAMEDLDARQFDALGQHHRVVWLVLCSDQEDKKAWLRDRLDTLRRRRSVRNFDAIQVIRYDRRD